jgi:hypothetical protein
MLEDFIILVSHGPPQGAVVGRARSARRRHERRLRADPVRSAAGARRTSEASRQDVPAPDAAAAGPASSPGLRLGGLAAPAVDRLPAHRAAAHAVECRARYGGHGRRVPGLAAADIPRSVSGETSLTVRSARPRARRGLRRPDRRARDSLREGLAPAYGLRDEREPRARDVAGSKVDTRRVAHEPRGMPFGDLARRGGRPPRDLVEGERPAAGTVRREVTRIHSWRG